DNLLTCKHIWATILAADAQGYLKANDSGRLRLVEMDDDEYDENRAEEWGEFDEYDEDDDFEDEEPHYPAYSPPVRQPARPARSKATGWKKHLAGLQSVMEADRVRQQNSWPAGREVLYIV